jgi:hypothetical protein
MFPIAKIDSGSIAKIDSGSEATPFWLLASLTRLTANYFWLLANK